MTKRILNRRTVLHTAGVLLLILVVLPFVMFAVPQIAGADHSFVVMSSSMEPTISAGDVVFVDEVPPDEIEEGDIITYDQQAAPWATPDDPHYVTHRVIEVNEHEDGLYFRTKGDALDEPDSEPVPAENVIGVKKFTVPAIGWVISYAGTTYGLIVLLVIPSMLLVLSEVWDLYRAYQAKKRSERSHESR